MTFDWTINLPLIIAALSGILGGIGTVALFVYRGCARLAGVEGAVKSLTELQALRNQMQDARHAENRDAIKESRDAIDRLRQAVLDGRRPGR